MKAKTLIFIIAIMVVILVSGFAPDLYQAATKFRSLIVQDSVTVGNDVIVTDDVTAGDDLTVSGDAAITGNVTGKVIRYPTPGILCNKKTNTITGTASYTATVTAISTPIYATCALDSISGDAARCAAAVGSGIVTVTVKNSNATPAANSSGATVYWEACGTAQ